MKRFRKPDKKMILPPVWHEIPNQKLHPIQRETQRVYINDIKELAVIVGIEEQEDGVEWIHLSMSQKDRIPTWEELREAKDLFIGKDKKAIQILPPEDEYVNIDPKVLHLYACLGNDPLPDFRHEQDPNYSRKAI